MDLAAEKSSGHIGIYAFSQNGGLQPASASSKHHRDGGQLLYPLCERSTDTAGPSQKRSFPPVYGYRGADALSSNW